MCLLCVTRLQQDRTSKDAALWNSFPQDFGFRGCQRRTAQTIPLRFAAATLLRYCAYSVETHCAPKAVVHRACASTAECLPLGWELGPRS